MMEIIQLNKEVTMGILSTTNMSNAKLVFAKI